MIGSMRRAQHHASPDAGFFSDGSGPYRETPRGTNEEKPIPSDIEDPWSRVNVNPVRDPEIEKSVAEAFTEPLPDPDAKPQRAKGATLDEFLDRVVTTFVAIDPDAEFEDIQRGLRLSVPGSRADRGTIADALEEMEDLSRRAHVLYSFAEATRAQSAVDRRGIRGALWERAVAGAKKHKDKPTKEDISSWMDSMLTDEVRALEVGEANADAAVSHLKQLAVLCRDRSETLRALLRSVP